MYTYICSKSNTFSDQTVYVYMILSTWKLNLLPKIYWKKKKKEKENFQLLAECVRVFLEWMITNYERTILFIGWNKTKTVLKMSMIEKNKALTIHCLWTDFDPVNLDGWVWAYACVYVYTHTHENSHILHEYRLKCN